MRFKQRQSAKLPEVNLIPMLNLMMGILAFFVMITMTLSNEKLWQVQLPGQQADPAVADVTLPDSFIVELDAQKGQPGPHDGLRVAANLATPDGQLAAPEAIASVGIGSRVRMVFKPVAEGLAIPLWTLDETAEQPAAPWRYPE